MVSSDHHNSNGNIFILVNFVFSLSWDIKLVKLLQTQVIKPAVDDYYAQSAHLVMWLVMNDFI